MKKNTLSMILGMTFAAGMQSNAMAHGWSEFPEARQSICYEQGGVWSGNPPNAACAQAKATSGSFPFVQRNEFSINIPNFRDMDAVKAAIPSGTLCYAADQAKKGMGTPHLEWTRTKIKAGTFEYIFKATAPHNPSYWEFYLTKPEADLSKSLAWEDLELIQSYGNVPVENGKYKMAITLPAERSGDATLFVRWQRDDTVGEGFYNCSDITIENDGVEPPTPTPNLNKGDHFIPADLTLPEIGDTVKYDIINKNGDIARSFSIVISSDNLNDWDRLLASEVNGWHETFKNGAVFIGDWHAEMKHYMYFANSPERNFFNAKDARASANMSILNGDSGQATLGGDMYEVSSSDKVLIIGQIAYFQFHEPVRFTQIQGTPVSIEYKNNAAIVETQNLTKNETLVFVATALQSNASKEFSFEVIGGGGETLEPNNSWDPQATYHQGDVVSFNQKQWKAHWWVNSDQNPESTYAADKWGVWRPVKSFKN
ncbi:MAG: chitin-binding protein [Aliivibrio sp.]|nr:chitin-binding protein [Aliivibrio sp.]